MKKIQWETSVPIFRNPIILQGLGLSLGIPFGIIFIIMLVLTKGDIFHSDAKYALLLIGIFLGLSFLLIFILYGGKYSPVYIIDENGITNFSQQKEAKKNKSINNLLIVLGVMRGNLTTVGTGLMAQSRQIMNIHWDSIRKIKYHPKQNTIIIKGGFAEKIAVFCTQDNYAQVVDIIESNINQNNSHIKNN